MVAGQRTQLRWVWVFWFAPLALGVAALAFGWHGFWLFLSVTGVVTGVISHGTVALRLKDYRARLAEVESQIIDD
jgi:hypothetical protein